MTAPSRLLCSESNASASAGSSRALKRRFEYDIVWLSNKFDGVLLAKRTKGYLPLNDIIREQARFLYDTIHLVRLDQERRHAGRVRATRACALELTPTQMNAVRTLREVGPAPLKQVAEALMVSPSSASTMVDRLVEMGLVQREQSQEDRREVVVQLTRQGQRVYQEVEDLFLDSFADILERIGPDCAEQWCEVYRKIRETVFDGNGLDAHGLRNESGTKP